MKAETTNRHASLAEDPKFVIGWKWLILDIVCCFCIANSQIIWLKR